MTSVPAVKAAPAPIAWRRWRIFTRLVALVLVWAAIAKALDPVHARAMLETWFRPAVSPWLVAGVVFSEFVIGAWLMAAPRERGPRWGAMAMLAAFCGVLALLLTLDDPPSCGCFGSMIAWKSVRMELWFAIGRNLVGLAVLVRPADALSRER